MKKIFLGLLTFFSLATYAQKSADIQAIKGQCGCHEVSFAYAETFAPDKNYKFHDHYKAGALEYVFVDEESKDKLVLMHLLVIDSATVIKHWREDWEYQATNLLAFQQGKSWKHKTLPKNEVKGQWTQKVFEVDDAPRYEGSASWVHKDGKHAWANTTDAPLPRREYTKRADYQVLRRGNRILVTDYGYLHEQDNDKIIRENDSDKLLAQEKGINDYRRTDEAKCKAAVDFWQKQRPFWVEVRAVWGEMIDQKKGISLREKTDGMSLIVDIDNLAKNCLKRNYTPEETRTKIKAVIGKYIIQPDAVSMK